MNVKLPSMDVKTVLAVAVVLLGCRYVPLLPVFIVLGLVVGGIFNFIRRKLTRQAPTPQQT